MILSSKQRQTLKQHKKITENKPTLDLRHDKDVVKEVYFPLVDPSGKPIEVIAKEGDKVKVGTIIAQRKDFYVPTYSSVSGVVKGVVDFHSGALNRKTKHLVIENDFKYEKESFKTYDDNISREEIIEAIKQSGIVGLGGAGFPTYVKYLTEENIDTILINAIGCEPFLTTDYVIIKDKIDLLMKGAKLLLKAADANQVIIALKRSKKELIKLVKEASQDYPFIKVKAMADSYPMGWERLLVKKALRRKYDNLPSEVGVIVNNSFTCISVADAILNGNMITERVVTFSGTALNSPSNVLVPIGTLVSKVIEKLGSYNKEEVSLIPGGPMTAKACITDEFAITPIMGGICALDTIKTEEHPCLNCGKCIETCPANLQPIKIKEAFARKDIEALIKLRADKCCECGLCSFVCPSKIELMDEIRKAKLYVNVMSRRRGGK